MKARDDEPGTAGRLGKEVERMVQDRGQAERFTYWKRPWHKWIILAAAALQLLCLRMNVQEYGRLSGSGIFSGSEWERYAVANNFKCAVNGMAAAGFLGIFLIGLLTRSQKSARLTEGLLLLFWALAWGAAGLVLSLTSPGGNRIVWAFILLLTLGGGIYSLWQYRSR